MVVEKYLVQTELINYQENSSLLFSSGKTFTTCIINRTRVCCTLINCTTVCFTLINCTRVHNLPESPAGISSCVPELMENWLPMMPIICCRLIHLESVVCQKWQEVWLIVYITVVLIKYYIWPCEIHNV